ncbi:MAG: DUF962 domain-containing protein [Alphaproteobacteria bacterium]|nr:DUF962 domain-containing protein [Alphaproteobacteria bacterium]
MAERPQTYAEFWPFYLAEHSRPATRGLHYFGTSLGILLAVYAVASGTWWLLLAALVAGYLFAWIAHFFIQKNRPATFTHPLWSFVSDFRMLGFWLSGRLGRELERHGIKG